MLDALASDFLSRADAAHQDASAFVREIRRVADPIAIDDLAKVDALVVQRALYSFAAKFPIPKGIEDTDCRKGRRGGVARALSVGIKHYEHKIISDLPGTRNDVNLVRRTLEMRGVEIRHAMNATRAQVLTQLRELVSATRCGDSVVFHFSGGSNRIPTDCKDLASGCLLKGWNVRGNRIINNL